MMMMMSMVMMMVAMVKTIKDQMEINIGKANLVKDELTKNAATSTDTMQESL